MDVTTESTAAGKLCAFVEHRDRPRTPQADRRVVPCRRLIGIGPNPSTKDAELIAFRIGEYHPRRVTLPDGGPPSTEGKEAFDLCG